MTNPAPDGLSPEEYEAIINALASAKAQLEINNYALQARLARHEAADDATA